MICPVSLVGQWLDEAKSKLDGSLRLYMYHGPRRIKDAARLATDYDLVVTTYQVYTRNPSSCTGAWSTDVGHPMSLPVIKEQKDRDIDSVTFWGAACL